LGIAGTPAIVGSRIKKNEMKGQNLWYKFLDDDPIDAPTN
jgi:hypothetical protein